MEERFRFVLRLLEGEEMSSLCREFGISRKTGYKIFERYKDERLESLSDRSRRPVRYAFDHVTGWSECRDLSIARRE
jgi:transposase